MSVLQLVLAIFIVSVTSKELNYYHTIQHLSEEIFLGQDVQNVSVLDLRDCDIENVASSTFTGMSKLTHLLLLHNNIGYLPKEVFNSLEELDYLRLDSNKLEIISKKLFAKLTKVTEIKISYNLLSKLEPSTFDTNINLKKLYLQFNRLQIIPARLFSKLTELVHLDLSNNFITHIDETAIPTANLQNLYVFANRLRYVSEKHINKNLKIFILDKNPLYCDCRLKPLYKIWIKQLQYNGWKPICAGPKNLSNIRWNKLSSNDFICNNEIITLYPEVTEIPVFSGQNVTMSCHVSGTVDLKHVKFTYGNNTEVTNHLQKYGPENSFSIQVIATTNSLWYNLTVSNVRKIDEEIYKCVVKNEHEMEVKVRVDEYPNLKKLYKSFCKNDFLSYV